MNNNNTNEKYHVLVTGCSGYIASHITQQLLLAGHRVRGTVRDATKVERVEHLRNIANECGGELEFVSCDLMKDDGWNEAVNGCDFVIHTASPLPEHQPDDAQELIVPARDGALRVLRACAAANSSVRRVVLTSSTASISGGRFGEKDADGGEHVFTPEDFSNLDEANPYEQSKCLAEQAAWKFMEDHDDFELSVVCPGFVLGPTLKREMNTTLTPVKRAMCRDDPGSVKLWFNIVDVRDVASAHVSAMTAENAAGKRYICCADVGLWMNDLSQILYDEFSTKGYSIATLTIPYPLLWVLGRCDAVIRQILPWIDVRHTYDISASERDLAFKVRTPRETIVDTAYSLIHFGIVPNKLPVE